MLAVLLVTLAACGDGEATETTDGTDTTAAATQSIEGPRGGWPRPVVSRCRKELSLTIQFQDGRSPVKSACNRFSGGYEIDGNSLTISELALTKKACPERLTEVDTSWSGRCGGWRRTA